MSKYKGIIINWDMGDEKRAKNFIDNYLSEMERKKLCEIDGHGGHIDLIWSDGSPDRFHKIHEEGLEINEGDSTDWWCVDNYLSTNCKFIIKATKKCTIDVYLRNSWDEYGRTQKNEAGSRCLHAEGKKCHDFVLIHSDDSRIITKKERYEVLERQHWKCNVCGCKLKYSEKNDFPDCKLAHIDHIHPFSKRDTYNGRDINELSNLQALCSDCNMKKHKKEN